MRFFTMHYLDALRLFHDRLTPRNYFEIGCAYGDSLALASVPAVAVDPNPRIDKVLGAQTRIFQLTSDEFFAANSPAAILGAPIDLAFIDGLHLAEFALRDFINIEAAATPESVILLDDVLPTSMDMARRERLIPAWTGDVYRLIPLLRHYRPDLTVHVFRVDIKGLGVVSRLDPTSRILRENLPAIERDLAAGAFAETNIAGIDGALDPRPARALYSHFRTLAASRGITR